MSLNDEANQNEENNQYEKPPDEQQEGNHQIEKSSNVEKNITQEIREIHEPISGEVEQKNNLNNVQVFDQPANQVKEPSGDFNDNIEKNTRNESSSEPTQRPFKRIEILANPINESKPPSVKTHRGAPSMVSLLVDTPEANSRKLTTPLTKSVVTKSIVKKVTPVPPTSSINPPPPPPPPPISPQKKTITIQPAMTVTKAIPQSAQSRKISTPKIPEWQYNLASTFLMTTDMTSTNSDIDPTDPHNQTDNNIETDQITEDMTRCICNSNHESDVMILCDSCKKWLHVDCVRLQNSQDVDPFICIYCQYEMAKAVKSFVRKKLASVLPIVQRYQDACQPTPIWNDLLQAIRDTQEVMKMIPHFLPTSSEMPQE
ncbi:PHD-finger family protein [Histomonas meleagridis]|uniref:PHD-finger family protein n=1 Tax=Histomonas meleagridis TaxID=135588 RepID=UPI00355AB293|nr:PHD-finger family protein [Histomonas meleagridis]KAH0797358.1 PHD-finger family protein [Histomonas meleagridis]